MCGNNDIVKKCAQEIKTVLSELYCFVCRVMSKDEWTSHDDERVRSSNYAVVEVTGFTLISVNNLIDRCCSKMMVVFRIAHWK